MSGLTDLPANMQRFIAVTDSECWQWTGWIGRGGYAQVRIDGKRWLIHRAAYEILVGPIPAGLQIDHLCRNTACCNPAHLEPVTCKVNHERRPNAWLPHCARGHELSGDNLIVSAQHRNPELIMRTCRTCHNLSQIRYRARKRAERAAA